MTPVSLDELVERLTWAISDMEKEQKYTKRERLNRLVMVTGQEAPVLLRLLSEIREPDLVTYMETDDLATREAAYLRLYATRCRERTDHKWETPNTRAATFEVIAKHIEERDRQSKAERDTLAARNAELEQQLAKAPPRAVFDSMCKATTESSLRLVESEDRLQTLAHEHERLKGELDACEQHVKILRAAKDALRATPPTPAAVNDWPHDFKTDSTGQFCLVCGSSVWGIHRFQPPAKKDPTP